MNNLLPTVKKTQDVLNDLFTLKRDRINENYIVFLRFIGFEDKQNHIRKLKDIYKKCIGIKDSFLLIEHALPIPYDIVTPEKAKNILTQYTEEDIRFGRYMSELMKEFTFLNKIASDDLIKDAMNEIVNLYIKSENNHNKDIIINFLIKLIMWLNQYKNMFNELNIDVPKVMYIGKIKKHEAYFLLLLSYLHCDVIYVNSQEDEVFQRIDINNQYTHLIKGCNYEEIAEEIISKIKIDVDMMIQDDTNIDNLLKPLKTRQAEISLDSIPYYFMRLIGIDSVSNSGITNHFNSLMALCENLEQMGVGFLRFENEIPAPSNDEINFIKADINSIDNYIYKFLDVRDEKKCKVIVSAFNKIKEVFERNESNITISSLNNFIFKLSIWLFRYKDELLKDIDIPKVFYYGKIKKHEAYFLIFASLLGIDVLYSSPDKSCDNIFKELDKHEELTKMKELLSTSEIIELPKQCSVVRKETIAYQATKEIHELIYSDSSETGIFKSWQLNENKVKPVILKTTLDEIKILWNEPSNVRPEFKVVDNTVYVPTIFVKVNGVFEKINEYWELIETLKDSKNTMFIKDFPFAKTEYDKQEFYSSAFLLNDEGLINKAQLFNSKLYKLSYLKISLQNLIIDKANELLSTNMLNVKIDDKFRLKVLMTAINLNENILRLLETYDFSSDIPKIVLYYDKREQLVEEDFITIGILSLIGFDIVMFTPTNYNNIELVFNQGIFDVIQLEKVGLDLEIPVRTLDKKKSFLSRIFGF